MELYIRKYNDYRTGTEITVSDYEDLKEELNNSNESKTESSESKTESSESESKSDEIDKYILNDKYLLDIVMIDCIPETDDYIIYLIYGCIYNIYHIVNTDNLEYAKTILKQLFSEINECQPFVVTGMSCAYKEEGYYPDPLPPLLMDEKGLLGNSLKHFITNQWSDYCIAVIVKNNRLIDYQQILPLF